MTCIRIVPMGSFVPFSTLSGAFLRALSLSLGPFGSGGWHCFLCSRACVCRYSRGFLALAFSLICGSTAPPHSVLLRRISASMCVRVCIVSSVLIQIYLGLWLLNNYQSCSITSIAVSTTFEPGVFAALTADNLIDSICAEAARVVDGQRMSGYFARCSDFIAIFAFLRFRHNYVCRAFVSSG